MEHLIHAPALLLTPFFSLQLWPHSNFGDEIKYISSHDKLQDRLKGSGYILGPITGDHWFVYVADHSETSALSLNRPVLELQPIVESPPSTGALTEDPTTETTMRLCGYSVTFFIYWISYYSAIPIRSDVFFFLPSYLQPFRTYHQPDDV